MKDLWKWTLPVVLLTLVAFLWLRGGASLGVGSSLSSAASGWSALRHYLDARDTPVEVIDGPLTAVEGQGTWVLTFPWSEPLTDQDLTAISGHLRRGGDLILAYSGDEGHLEETLVLNELNLELVSVRSSPPLLPWEWWRQRRRSWHLVSQGSSRRLEMVAISQAPSSPSSARVLYRHADSDRALIYEVQRQRGRVLVLPRDVLSNGRLAMADNLGLVEELAGRFDGPWRFDEYHHGWKRSVDETSASTVSQAWDMFVIHLLVIYGLAVLALIRRFGPAWMQRPVVAGSAAEFLRGVGSLHHRLGHHREAAQWMLKRARDVDPQLDWQGVDADVHDGPGLVALGRDISRRQRRRTS